MSIIKKEDIIGYQFSTGDGQKIVCPSCIEAEDLKELKEEEVLTKDKVDEDDKIFCDRCGEEITH